MYEGGIEKTDVKIFKLAKNKHEKLENLAKTVGKE